MQRTQLNRVYDIAVVGSGFAGSLIAMIAQRLGHSVILLERGKHPRTVIGESSTPLSNLLLEELAIRYNLPAIKPLAKWGSWQRSCPDVACGLKRGFTFYHHQLGAPDAPDPERRNQLLVAASPHDEIADTHWYRADFDAMLVREAQTLGVDYMDEVALDQFVDYGRNVGLQGKRAGHAVAFRARFVIDATGPRGFLHRALQLSESKLPNYPRTQALYSYFSDVSRPAASQADSSGEEPPYPPEDAAVHHVFDGAWIWVLRFNNGITSAGVAATERAAAHLRLCEGETAWLGLLNSLSTLREQFATARTEQPFTYVPQLSFLTGQVCGEKWVLLPSAAGFVDPLLSTGFPLTLLGVGRLTDIFERSWETSHFTERLQHYSRQTLEELHATSRLIAGLYANMNNFPVFASLSLLYFAAASYSETARRLKKPELAPSFLLHDHPTFGPACRDLCERALHTYSEAESVRLREDTLRAIEPFDIAGLGNRQRRNWYPVDAEELLRSGGKVGATRDEISSLLDLCGFYECPAGTVHS